MSSDKQKRKKTMIARLHIGHSCITRSFLLKGEEQPVSIGFDELLNYWTYSTYLFRFYWNRKQPLCSCVCCFRRFRLRRFLTFWKRSIFFEKFKLIIFVYVCVLLPLLSMILKLYVIIPILAHTLLKCLTSLFKYNFKIVHIPILTHTLLKSNIWWQNVYRPDITALVDWA